MFATFYRNDLSISGEFRVLRSVTSANVGLKQQIRGGFMGFAAVPCLRRHPFLVCGALNIGDWNAVPVDSPGLEAHRAMITLGLRPAVEGTFAKRFTVQGFAEVAGILTARPGRRDLRSDEGDPVPICGWIGAALSVRR